MGASMPGCSRRVQRDEEDGSNADLQDSDAFARSSGSLGQGLGAVQSGNDNPLVLAAERHDMRGMAALLKAGFGAASKRDADKTTALHWARNTATVRLLIDHGADVNAKDSHRMTPLMWAAANLRVGVVRELLERGAFVNAEDSKGLTALSHALLAGDERISDETTDRKEGDADGGSSLALRLCANVAQLLFESGAILSEVDKETRHFRTVVRQALRYPATRYSKLYAAGYHFDNAVKSSYKGAFSKW